MVFTLKGLEWHNMGPLMMESVGYRHKAASLLLQTSLNVVNCVKRLNGFCNSNDANSRAIRFTVNLGSYGLGSWTVIHEADQQTNLYRLDSTIFCGLMWGTGVSIRTKTIINVPMPLVPSETGSGAKSKKSCDYRLCPCVCEESRKLWCHSLWAEQLTYLGISPGRCWDNQTFWVSFRWDLNGKPLIINTTMMHINNQQVWCLSKAWLCPLFLKFCHL